MAMFSFNRKEQIAILMLSAALIVGAVVSYIDSENPDAVPNFHVEKNAVPVPNAAPQVAPATPTEGGPIDLNRATAKDFEQLPGIGPQIARRIVAFRDQHGAFRAVDSLTQVRGIGPKTLERLKPHLTLTTP